MEIKKISENYNFYKDGNIYFLALGGIKVGTKHVARLEISGVKAKEVNIKPKCGCTTSNQTILDDSTIQTDVVFSASSSGSFSKTVEIREKTKTTLIKITGTIYAN